MPLFKKSRGSNSKIFVPGFSNTAYTKYYIDLMDLLANSTADFRQMVIRLLLMLGSRKELKILDTGSLNDAYAVSSFMESSLNAISLIEEDSVQREFRCREDILELESKFDELTLESPTEDQLSMMLEWETILKSDYLSTTLSEKEENIVNGHRSRKRILGAEHDTQENKVQKEKDSKELAEIKASHFKGELMQELEVHFRRKSNEAPKLSSIYMQDLQQGLDKVKSIRNGSGTLEMAKAESARNKKSNIKTE